MTQDRNRSSRRAGRVARALTSMRGNKGAVAMMFGIAAIPLLLLVGLAVDFAFVSQARAQLDLAADTAALTAAKTAGQAFVANIPGAPTPISQGEAAGLAWFNAQVGTIPNATVTGAVSGCTSDPCVVVAQSGNAFTATVSYTVQVQSMFQALFGIPFQSVSDSSAAEIVANAYVDVTFLLDNSSSMLIASTTAGVTQLQPATAGSSCFQATNGPGGFLPSATGPHATPWIASGSTSTYAGGINSTTGLPQTGGKTAISYCDSGTIGAYTCTQGSTIISSMSNTSYGINTLQGCQCAFACHWVAPTAGNTFTSGGNTYSLDYYGIARSLGVQLRFDVVQSAVETAIQYMQTSETADNIPNQFGAAVYEFNTNFTQIWPPTGDSASQAITDMACLQTTATGCSGNALAAAQAITTPVVSDAADTNFPAAMSSLVTGSAAAGDGSTQAKAKKSLIIVTDGIQDWGGRSMVDNYSLSAGDGSNANGAEGPISLHDCDAIKALGYTVYVLYTTYITTPTSIVIYNESLVPYVTGSGEANTAYDLQGNLQGCASAPGNYAEASSPAAITAALQSMVQAALNSGARLTL
jgi:Flp pilus assembly protein TadG